MDEYNVKRNMVNHPPDKVTQARMEAVREDYHAAAHRLNGIMGPSRERSLALTKLEESLMWAMAALARGNYDHRQRVQRGNEGS